MDQINPFTNAPTPTPGKPQGAPVTPIQPPKPQEPKPKSDFDIKPIIKAIVMLIIGVVVAKLALDSVIPMFKPQPKPAVKETRSAAKPSSPKAAAPAKAKSSKGKQAEPVSLSETFAAAKKVAKPEAQPQPTGDQYVINGIFLSEADGMSSAIVNNKVVQVGDSVDGAVVQSITIEGVELSKDNATIKVRNK
jgi:hypothetical protein